MKLRIVEDGKSFEVEVLFIVKENQALVSVAYAGNVSSCRAIHAALYQNTTLEIVHEDGRIERVVTNDRRYKRVETIDGKVCKHICLPRSLDQRAYQESVNDNLKNESEYTPERVIFAKKDEDLHERAGLFIAQTYGVPKKWARQYVSILKEKQWVIFHDVTTTDLVPTDWEHFQSLMIKPMKEKELLDVIEQKIKFKQLKVKSPSFLGQATFRENMTTEEYLRENAHVLMKKINQYMKPQYDGSYISPYFAEMKKIPVPAQARASTAALNVLKKKKGVFMVGDMGSGKSIKSISAVYATHRQRVDNGATTPTRVLVVGPSNVIPKWEKKEVPEALREGVYTIRRISSTEDALAYVEEVRKNQTQTKPNQIEFVLVSTDRMKLTAQGFALGAKWDSQKYVWKHPDTGEALVSPTIKKDDDPDDHVAGWKDAVEKPSQPPTLQQIEDARKNGELLPSGLPNGYVKKWSSNVRSFQTAYHKGKNEYDLARPARKDWGETRGKARWMIAQIFQRKLRNHFHLGIIDEVHQMKASDSGRGLALAKILKSIRKVLMLTGTLTNGSASSIQSLLWRVFPHELIKNGFTHETSKEQWAQRYGVLERIVTKHDSATNVGVTTNRKKETVVLKERPGIAPELITNYLLDKSVFVELSDLELPLVELKEEVIPVELDEQHYGEYKRFEKKLEETSLSMRFELGSAAWSYFQPSTINYADQPQYRPPIEFKKIGEDGKKHILATVTAPEFPKSYINEKEKTLIDYIHKELRKRRKCIVFTNFTGEYSQNERLQNVLKDYGISSEILNDKISTEKRFDWLNEQSEKGTEVLIMNMRLVEVGLDLIEYPTIIYYQLNNDINVVRQSSRRAWRLAQTKICKVAFLVADDTQQLTQFQRLMSRRVSAMIVEGRIERSDELAKYADEGQNLTRQLADSISAWEKASKKDIDTSLKIVSEDDIKERLKLAFERLTRETIQLCGYDPDNMPDFNDVVEMAEENIQNDAELLMATFEKELEDVDLAELFELDEPLEKETSTNVHSFKEAKERQQSEDKQVFLEPETDGEQLDLFDLLG